MIRLPHPRAIRDAINDNSLPLPHPDPALRVLPDELLDPRAESSCVQGPCQLTGASGQCRYIADHARGGSAEAGIVVLVSSHMPSVLGSAYVHDTDVRCVNARVQIRGGPTTQLS